MSQYRKILLQKIAANIILLIKRTKIKKIKKRQIEDKESSNSYEMEAVEFLDHINVDNGDFDDNAIDYISEKL